MILINISRTFYRSVGIAALKYYCYGRYWQIFFKKKRDLSDQSQGGDERKKVKEGSSASSTDDTDVFGEGLESADCNAILFNYLKNLEVKVKEIFDLANTTNESQIKGEQQLKCLTESVEFISARFDEYEADRKKKR